MSLGFVDTVTLFESCNDNINGSDSMKYFTKEVYEEMQVYGSLVFSDTKEE